jgi:hypothetical protein
MRVFISHAWEDKPVALELARLPPFVKAWVDVRELLGGQDLDPTIIEAIEDSHVFLTLVSRVAMTKPYVNKELAWALEREAKKDRVFILPVIIEPGISLAASDSETFRRLGTRLFVSATGRSEAEYTAARADIAQTLFHWASDWLDRFEPRGDHDRLFVERLEGQLVEYRERLFALKAILEWPLAKLTEDAVAAQLVQSMTRYNEFTDGFAARLLGMDAEVRWRFGAAAQRGYKRLRDFVIDEVYQGAAFALNDIIESLNQWDGLLRHDAAAFAAADMRRAERIEALEPILEELVERSTDFVQTLKS